MTPEERQLIEDLFDRLVRLESMPRDAEAENAIAEGLQRAPHALYAMVQTVLVQDEALKRADSRIRELMGENENAPRRGSFLDSMRNALSGRTSVPTVRPATASESDPRSTYASPNVAPTAAPLQSTGSSFLGTAAASAAGMIGGGLLLNSISSMFGHHSGSAFAAVPPERSPWNNNVSGSDLAREAGLNDIDTASNHTRDSRASSLFDSSDTDEDQDDFGDADDDGSDFGGDFGGDDSGSDI
jgi:uncharacterized protein